MSLKKISTIRDQRSLINAVKKDRRMTSSQLAVEWTLANGKTASAATVRRLLQEHDLMWRPACKKPRLTPNHLKQRLEFCKAHEKWSKLRWRDVVFSDEMNVEVDSRKNRVMLRRTTEEKYKADCIVERTKQGSGSIGIWACMSYDGVKFFKLFQGRLNASSYEEILENYLMPSLDLMDDKEFTIFQQDNAPCHTAKRITEFFAENNVKTLKWPANSPDLNCIENLWSWLDTKLSKMRIGNVDELKLAICDLLTNVPVQIFHNLVDSMPTRINECLQAKGGQTRY